MHNLILGVFLLFVLIPSVSFACDVCADCPSTQGCTGSNCTNCSAAIDSGSCGAAAFSCHCTWNGSACVVASTVPEIPSHFRFLFLLSPFLVAGLIVFYRRGGKSKVAPGS